MNETPGATSQAGARPVPTGPRFWNPEEKAWVSARAPRPADPSQPPQRVFRPPWTLTVTDVEDITPLMRRVTFTSVALKHFENEPGADFTITVPAADGELARRHYTLRSFDRENQRVTIDFAMHGEGPGVAWAAAAKPGAELEVTGPVIRQGLRRASWYLFAGDESAIPAIWGMIESLPGGTPVKLFIEVTDEHEKQPIEAAAQVEEHWLYRGATPGNETTLLHEAIASADLPAEEGQMFLFGETGRMRELRKSLLGRGVSRDAIFAMGYWRPGRLGGDEVVRDE